MFIIIKTYNSQLCMLIYITSQAEIPKSIKASIKDALNDNNTETFYFKVPFRVPKETVQGKKCTTK